MLASDIQGTLTRMEREYGSDAPAREMLIKMGCAPEEVEPLVGAVIDRAAHITKRGEHPLDSAGINWLDGFMVGVSLARRQIKLEESSGR